MDSEAGVKLEQRLWNWGVQEVGSDKNPHIEGEKKAPIKNIHNPEVREPILVPSPKVRHSLLSVSESHAPNQSLLLPHRLYPHVILRVYNQELFQQVHSPDQWRNSEKANIIWQILKGQQSHLRGIPKLFRFIRKQKGTQLLQTNPPPNPVHHAQNR